MTKEEIINLLFTKSIILYNGKKGGRRHIRKIAVLELLPDYLFNDRRYLIFSHVVWNLYNPDTPIVKNSNYCIHHRDCNKLNDNIDNLEKELHGKHTSKHNIGNTYSKGHKQTLEDRMKKSLAHKGKKKTKEHCDNMSKARKGLHSGKKNPFYGRKHSEESKRKMSISKRKAIV